MEAAIKKNKAEIDFAVDEIKNNRQVSEAAIAKLTEEIAEINSSCDNTMDGVQRKVEETHAIAESNSNFLKKLEVRLYKFNGESRQSLEANERRLRK